MTFVKDDGEHIEFKRCVNESGCSEFYIDNVGVYNTDYSARLEELNIFIKAKNFLVGLRRQVNLCNPNQFRCTKAKSRTSPCSRRRI